MLEVETFGIRKVPVKVIKNFMSEILDTSVAGIIGRT